MKRNLTKKGKVHDVKGPAKRAVITPKPRNSHSEQYDYFTDFPEKGLLLLHSGLKNPRNSKHFHAEVCLLFFKSSQRFDTWRSS